MANALCLQHGAAAWRPVRTTQFSELTGRRNFAVVETSRASPIPGLVVFSAPVRVRSGGDQQGSGEGFAKQVKGEDGDDKSYLGMWKRARERQEQERLQKVRQNPVSRTETDGGGLGLYLQDEAEYARREQQFAKILQVPVEERDKVQRMQVVDRAAAALAAAHALVGDKQGRTTPARSGHSAGTPQWVTTSSVEVKPPALQQRPPPETGSPPFSSATTSTLRWAASPGPDFWTWAPPSLDVPNVKVAGESLRPNLLKAESPLPNPMPLLLEKEKGAGSLALPLESTLFEEISSKEDFSLRFQSRAMPSLPPLQSLLEVGLEMVEVGEQESLTELSIQVPGLDIEAAEAVKEGMQSVAKPTTGVHSDGSRWWQEKGVEFWDDGVTCNWTVIRGVSADGRVEWEEKFWEAADAFDYKELGAEKSGRDASGGVWREFWQEAMWQDAKNGLVHIEKSADKWAKNGEGGQWHEKWWEHYDASGRAEKWADKWSQVDPSTLLEVGHAHVWHERWGEEYDGQGASMKYTDKWAERTENGRWTKWGDKWDEHFDRQGCGTKQGETWWEGQHGERWNRTWGEGHHGTGWVHKYGKSSSGEHWDTHEQQDTWYEQKPHFGFQECFDASRELRRSGKKRRKSL